MNQEMMRKQSRWYLWAIRASITMGTMNPATTSMNSRVA